jgi:hypothetical protein
VNAPRLLMIAVAGFATAPASSDAGMLVNRPPAIAVVPTALCGNHFCRCLEATIGWILPEQEVRLCDPRFAEFPFTLDAVDGAHASDFASSNPNSTALSVVGLVETKSGAFDAPTFSVKSTGCRLPSEYFLTTGTDFHDGNGAGVYHDIYAQVASLDTENRPHSIIDEFPMSKARPSISRNPAEPNVANAQVARRNAKESRLNSGPDWLSPAFIVGSIALTVFLLLRRAKVGHDSSVTSYLCSSDSFNSHRFYTF